MPASWTETVSEVLDSTVRVGLAEVRETAPSSETDSSAQGAASVLFDAAKLPEPLKSPVAAI
jgi:hypothetical protein